MNQQVIISVRQSERPKRGRTGLNLRRPATGAQRYFSPSQEVHFQAGVIWGHIDLILSQEQKIQTDPTVSSSDISDREYEDQKRAFSLIPVGNLAGYIGQYVASHNGEIIGHDIDLSALTGRIVRERGDIPFYVTKVGDENTPYFASPFFR